METTKEIAPQKATHGGIRAKLKEFVQKCFKKNSNDWKLRLLVPLLEVLWDIHTIKPLALGESSLKVRLFFSLYPNEEWPHMKIANQFFTCLPAVDFFDERHPDILYQLRHSKFIPYASVVVIVHRSSQLQSVVEAMSDNRYLRYKSKIILCRYNLNITTKINTPSQQQSSTKMAKEKVDAIRSIFSNLGAYVKSEGPNNFKMFDQDLSIDVNDAHRDHVFFQNLVVDNLTLVQWFMHDDNTDYCFYANVLFGVLVNPIQPLEIGLQDSLNGGFAITSTSTAAHYVYSINPSLAIIINNNFFTPPHDIREGSQQDVIRLIRELKIARIPYIIVEDSGREELLRVLRYIESKDFRPLKGLLLFVMSHGDSNDVLYTHDGHLNIKEDIVKPLQANKSLENVKLNVAIIACRGKVDMDCADEDDLEDIQPTDNSHLNKNTIVMYSVPNEVQSLRSEESGCPFVQIFCQHFRHIGHTDDVRVLDEKINTDLQKMDYYHGLPNCAELIMGDVDQSHNIIQTPDNFFQMVHLLKSIADEFPLHERNFQNSGTERIGRQAGGVVGVGSSSYVCGVLNADKFRKDDNVNKYFAKDLEADTFSVLGHEM